MESLSLIDNTNNTNNECSIPDIVVSVYECPICLLELDKDIITLDCCSQKLHKKCYNTCVSYKMECPLCRNTDKFSNKSHYKYVLSFKDNFNYVVNKIMIIVSWGFMLFFMYNIIIICYRRIRHNQDYN